MKDVVVLQPGESAYRAGVGCGLCDRDDRPILIQSATAAKNLDALMGDRTNDGVCLDCMLLGARLLILSGARPKGPTPMVLPPVPPPRFKPGDMVRIVRFLDETANKTLIGIQGRIKQVEDNAAGEARLSDARLQVNYYIDTKRGHIYAHEEELEPVVLG
jgi:hypothetical protein